MSSRPLTPKASPQVLHPPDIPPEYANRHARNGLLLDRPRLGAGEGVAGHPHDPHHHDPERRHQQGHACDVDHEGNRCLDDRVSCFRLWFFYRVLSREFSRPEGQQAAADAEREGGVGNNVLRGQNVQDLCPGRPMHRDQSSV